MLTKYDDPDQGGEAEETWSNHTPMRATADESDLGGEEHRTDDGGSWWSPHGVPPSDRT